MTGNYQTDGFLLVRQAIPPADLEPLSACIHRQVGIYANEMFNDGKIKDPFDDLPFGQRLAALHRENEIRLRSWNQPALGPELHSLIQHPGIVDALEPLLGPNVSFNGDYHLRPKMPDSELTAFPLHQDSQYYGRQSRHAHIITVWIPLVDVDEINGCLYLIPGSNAWELIESKRDKNMNMRSFEDPEERGTPVPMPMKKGDILLFSNMTFHGSKINHTDQVRWSIDIRYCRTPGTYTAPPRKSSPVRSSCAQNWIGPSARPSSSAAKEPARPTPTGRHPSTLSSTERLPHARRLLLALAAITTLSISFQNIKEQLCISIHVQSPAKSSTSGAVLEDSPRIPTSLSCLQAGSC